MKYLKLFENFFSDIFIFNSNIDPYVEMTEFKRMEHELEFPSENDPYLINYYVTSLGKLMKYAKENNLSLLHQIDMNKVFEIYNMVRKRQRVIMDTRDKLQNYYNEYIELTK